MFDAVISGFWVLRETLCVIAEERVSRTDVNMPLHSAKVTPEWLTRVLFQSVPGPRVADVKVLNEVSGTTTHVRLAVTYNEAGQMANLPTRLFLKLPPHEMRSRVFVSLFDLARNETRFYNRVSHEVHSVVPKVFFAKAGKRGSGFVIVMEDLSSGNARIKSIVDSCTLDELRGAMQTLAGIHARFWESPRFCSDLSWLLTYETDRNVRFNRLLRKVALKRTYARFGDIIPGEIVQHGRFINRYLECAERKWSGAPQTLIHGDPHLGNMYFTERGAGFLDWQVVRRGWGMRDVSYFLILSLPPEQRRTYERDLIREYLDTLSGMGIEMNFQTAWEQYRLCGLYAWIAAIVTAAAGTFQLEAPTRAGVERSAAALLDLDSVGALQANLS